MAEAAGPPLGITRPVIAGQQPESSPSCHYSRRATESERLIGVSRETGCLAAGASAQARALPAGARERGEARVAESGASLVLGAHVLAPRRRREVEDPAGLCSPARGLRASIGDVECDLLVPWRVSRDLALPVPLQSA